MASKTHPLDDIRKALEIATQCTFDPEYVDEPDYCPFEEFQETAEQALQSLTALQGDYVYVPEEHIKAAIDSGKTLDLSVVEQKALIGEYVLSYMIDTAQKAQEK